MLDPALTFDRYFVGGVNELAATAARRTAESPGHTYNPLVICGPSRSGKTHLLHAIAHYATELESDLALHLEGAEAIAERVTRGIAAGDLEPLNSVLAGLDLLLVDEVDHLSGMVRTQEELVGIATRMTQEGRQLVLASRELPGQIPGLIRSFRELLDRGLVVQIGPLDEETRQTLIDRAAGDRGAVLNADVIRALAAYELEDVPTVRRTVDRLLDLALEEGRQPKPGDVLRILRAGDSRPAVTDEFGSFLDDVSRSVAAVVETAPWRRRVGSAILRWEGEGLRTTRLEAALQADTPPDVDALLENYARAAHRLLQIRRELGEIAITERLDDPGDLERAERILAESKAPRPTQGATVGSDPGSGNGSVTPAAAAARAPTPPATASIPAFAAADPTPGSIPLARATAVAAHPGQAVPGTSAGPSEHPAPGAGVAGVAGVPSRLGSVHPDPSSAPSPDSWFLNPEKVVLDWTDVDGRLVLEPR